MALDAADWTVSITGDVRWTGSGGAVDVTVLEMHRWLNDLADQAVAVSASSDLHAITDDTSSERATDNIIALVNGYNIDDTAAQHIFDGSVEQDGGDTFYRGLVVVGSVPSDGDVETTLQIEQDGAIVTNFWGATTNGIALNGDATSNTLLRIMVKTRVDGADIDGGRIRVYAREPSTASFGGHTYAEFSVTMGAGNNTAAIFTGPDLNNTTAIATIAAYDQFSNTEGYQPLTIGGVAYDFYSQWLVTGGGSLPASPAINDLYEYTKWLTRRGADGSTDPIHGFVLANTPELFRGITHEWTYTAEGGAQPATNDDIHWGLYCQGAAWSGSPTVGEKITGDIGSGVGRLLAFDITTDTAVIAMETGTFVDTEVLTGFTSTETLTLDAAPVGQATGGGSARILAVDDNGTTGTVWVQLLKGTTPSTAVCYESTDHTQVMTSGTVTGRTLPATFLGVSTGSALIGAFGIGLDPDDLTTNDLVFDLLNAPITPPNNVTWTITGVVSGEDRILVGPSADAGVTLDVAQDTLNDTGLNTSGITSITVTTAIPTDTPASGTIRIEADDGRYLRVPYDSYTGSVYTIPSFDFTSPENCTTGNNVFISYVDLAAVATTASFTSVFLSTRDLFVRVRDGGTAGDNLPTKTFQTPSQLTSSGGGASNIRTPDA